MVNGIPDPPEGLLEWHDRTHARVMREIFTMTTGETRSERSRDGGRA